MREPGGLGTTAAVIGRGRWDRREPTRQVAVGHERISGISSKTNLVLESEGRAGGQEGQGGNDPAYEYNQNAGKVSLPDTQGDV